MDEYTDAFRDGWNAALEAMQQQCKQLWHPNGDTVQGVTNVELVWMRFPPAEKARAE